MSVARSGATGPGWTVRRIAWVAVLVALAGTVAALGVMRMVVDPVKAAAADERAAQQELLKNAPVPATLPKGKGQDGTHAPG